MFLVLVLFHTWMRMVFSYLLRLLHLCAVNRIVLIKMVLPFKACWVDSIRIRIYLMETCVALVVVRICRPNGSKCTWWDDDPNFFPEILPKPANKLPVCCVALPSEKEHNQFWSQNVKWDIQLTGINENPTPTPLCTLCKWRVSQ